MGQRHRELPVPGTQAMRSAFTRCLMVLAAARSADQATPPLPDDAAAVVVDSERGDDTHPGTAGRPLRTLGEARDRLRASPSLHMILLRGGAHHTAAATSSHWPSLRMAVICVGLPIRASLRGGFFGGKFES